MTRPRLLDLFCCEGGAAAGYIAAGFDVVGVDTDRARGRYYPGEFVHGDALEFATRYGAGFDVIHASPPCQAYSVSRHTHDVTHPELIAPARHVLRLLGRPYVLENVYGARRQMINPLMLCGSEFDLLAVDTDGTLLQLERHRLFESNRLIRGNGGCRHLADVPVGGVYGGTTRTRDEARRIRKGGYVPRSRQVRESLLGGCSWMTDHGLAQCIPPVYAAHIGRQMLTDTLPEQMDLLDLIGAE